MSKKITVVSSLIVLSLLITVTTFAATETSATERSRENHIISKLKFSGITGTVVAINNTQITINEKNGNIYTVDTINAKINKGKQTLELSDIKIGDHIVVRGTVNGSNVTASSILENDMEKNGFMGEITSINNNDFTIKTINKGTQKATQTVATNSNTKITKNNQPASLSDLALGQKVIVSGTRDATTNTINADTVKSFANIAGTRLNGTVQSILDNILNVIDNNNEIYTIDASKAKIIAKKGHTANLSTIKINDKISIFGTQSTGSTNINARIIRNLSQTTK